MSTTTDDEIGEVPSSHGTDEVVDTVNTDNVVEVVKDTEPVREKVNLDKHYTNVTEFTGNTDATAIGFPSILTTYALKLSEQLSENTETETLNKYSVGQITAIGAVINGSEKNGQVSDTLDHVADEWLNSEDTDALSDHALNGIRNVSSKSKPKGEISGPAALLSFSNLLGIGGITQIPLYHSGFWITLDIISEVDIIGLEVKLGHSLIRLGRDTNGMVFGNSDVIYNDIILDFILEKTISTSVAIDNVNQLRKMIRIQDLHILILGLVDAMSPKGIDVIMGCSNATTDEVDENGNSKACDFVFNAKLNPKTLLWIAKDILTEEQKTHMNKRARDAVSIAEVEYYCRNLECIQEKDFNVEKDDNVLFVMRLKTPVIDEHIEQGNAWVDNTIATVDEFIGEGGDDTSRAIKVSEITKATILNTYIHYIVEIRYEGAIIRDRKTISEMLDKISVNKEIYKATMDIISKFIKESIVAMVGTPAYTCPACNHSEDGPNEVFKEVIPINITSSFLDQSTLMKQKAMDL